MTEDNHYKNTALQDRIRTRRSYFNPNGGGLEEEGQDPIPEDIVNKLEPFVGDGKARLTVSAGLGSSVDFGFKAEALVSATVTCNNDPDDIRQVNDIMYPLVEELSVYNHARASALRDQMMPNSDKRLNLSVESDTVPPPAVPQKASRPTTSKPVASKGKPVFKR